VLRRVFKAFHYRDFRVQWIGACTSAVGTWMQITVQSWVVFDLSKSARMLGLDSFLGQIPILMFSLIGGVIADRIDRRRVLLGSQYVQMTCAFLLTALLALHRVQVWHILSMSFVVGCAQSFGGPAYSALVPSLVEKEDLPNAIALNSIQFNLARVIGPVLGGLVYTGMGAAWCFGFNGLSYVAAIISLLLLHIRFMPPTSGESILTGVKQGIGFIRKQGAMVGLIGLAFCMTALAIPVLTFLPVFAKEALHGGPMTLSLLLSSSGAGSVTGALIVAAFGNVKRKGLIALLTMMVLGCGIAGFAVSKIMLVSCLLLFISGASMMGVFSMVSSLVQLITANEMRGRVMSVYNVAFRGGMPLGSLATGWLVPIYSAPRVLFVNGLLLVAVGCYFLLLQRRVAAL
jgi:predicted MFS family arabinose efflux permease